MARQGRRLSQMAAVAPPRPVSAGRMAPLDDVDLAIIDALRHDGRMSMRALATALHISRANVYQRIERLEREQVITGYTISVDPERCGQSLSAYLYLKISQHSWKVLREKLLHIPEVDHGALVAGDYDIVLIVRTRDAAALRDLVLTRLQAIPEVLGTQTVLIFDELDPLRPDMHQP